MTYELPRSDASTAIALHLRPIMLYVLSPYTVFLTYLTWAAYAAPTPVPAGQIASATTYLILNADVSQPISTTPGTNPEQFNFTVAGDWAGATPVNCSANWNAGVASLSNLGDKEIDVKTPAAFSCSDVSLSVDMTRIRVEPWFLWELTVQAKYVPLRYLFKWATRQVGVPSFDMSSRPSTPDNPHDRPSQRLCILSMMLSFRDHMLTAIVLLSGFSSAVWRMKNMYETPGWTTTNASTTQWHFDGGQGHPISGAPAGTLSECLREHTCASN